MSTKTPMAKFLRIQQALEEDIRGGVYQVGNKIPSERDLAKRLGASHMTVNKAICGLEANGIVIRQGNGTYVAPKKETIFNRIIGYVGPTAQSMEHAGLPEPLLNAAERNGYITSVFDINNLIQSQDSFRLFTRENPLALIIDGRGSFPFHLVDEIPHGTRLMFIDNYSFENRVERASYILGDYFDGGCQAAHFLLEKGRKNIAIITFGEGCPIKQGAEHILRQAGLEIYKVIVKDETNDDEWIRLSQDKKLDGIIGATDFCLVKALEAMRDHGVKIPDDVTPVGYFNTPWAQTLKIASVDPQRQSMADMAMMALQQNTTTPLDIKIKPKIVYNL